MLAEQLMLWEEPEIDILKRELRKTQTTLDKMRRGQYARLCEVTKAYDELDLRLKILEKNICLER